MVNLQTLGVSLTQGSKPLLFPFLAALTQQYCSMGVAKNVKHLNWARIVTGAKMDALEAGQEIPAWAEAVSQ